VALLLPVGMVMASLQALPLKLAVALLLLLLVGDGLEEGPLHAASGLLLCCPELSVLQPAPVTTAPGATSQALLLCSHEKEVATSAELTVA
jgi:hypothetical protein